MTSRFAPVHGEASPGGRRIVFSATGVSGLAILPALIAALVGAAIQGFWIPLDSDVSWLLTVCDRLLAGDRLYVDIVEVNPPASVWLYFPLVSLARFAGLRPELLVAAAFLAAGLASTFATMRLAGRLEDPPAPLLLSAVLGCVTIILPMGLFAQREHAALLLALPSLAALAIVGSGTPLPRRTTTFAGVAAGLVIAIKPHFALAILFPAAWAALRRRTVAPMIPAIAAAAAVVAIYAGAALLFVPEYLRWIPVFAQTYLKMHAPLEKLALSALLFPAAALLPVLVARIAKVPTLAVVFLWGGIGFTLAAVLQAKNYANHWLPGASLALVSSALLIAAGSGRRELRAVAALLWAAVAFWQAQIWSFRPDPAVEAELRQVAPVNPTMIALSRELSSGHPLTRNVDGRWVGTRASLFTAAAARDWGLGDPLARQAYRADIRDFARDVITHRPTVVLVDRPDKSWLLAEPEVVFALRNYRRAGRAGNTEIWLRG